MAGAAGETITTVYTELSLPIPCFDCRYRTGVALTDGDRAKLMGGTASKIYKWSPTKA